ARTGEPVHTFAEHDDTVTSVAFSPDGRRIASAARDGIVIVWDVLTRQRIHRFEVLRGGGSPLVAFSPDGARLAATNHGRSLMVGDVATGGEPAPLPSGMEIMGVAFSPDGSRIALGGYNPGKYAVEVRDATTYKLLRPLEGHDRATRVAFSPDGTRLA